MTLKNTIYIQLQNSTTLKTITYSSAPERGYDDLHKNIGEFGVQSLQENGQRICKMQTLLKEYQL